jgi:hypothetical protein
MVLMDRSSAIDWVTGAVAEALEKAERIGPAALTFLLSRYRTTGRADLQALLEQALTHALEEYTVEETTIGRARWLTMFAGAVTVSGDDRLRAAGDRLAKTLRGEWGGEVSIEACAPGLDACMKWSMECQPALLAAVIDELERIVGAAYDPGEGVARSTSQLCSERGRLVDHVALAATLLTAYDVTARLPYSMLAEELMGFANRVLWDETASRYRVAAATSETAFLLNCSAASVLCRLGALHDTPAYREGAVVAPEARYAHQADRLLDAEEARYRQFGLASAAYGLALQERMALSGAARSPS